MYQNSNIEIRNPKQYQNPNAQNSKQKRDGIRICVLVIDIFVIRSLFRASIFEFRISPSLSSGLNTSNQGLFQIAISGCTIFETGH